MSNRPPIPEAMKRKIRQEAGYRTRLADVTELLNISKRSVK